MLFRKLIRDLSESKVQFFSIFMMSFLGLFIFVGLDSECTGMSAEEFRYYTEQNLADLWVRGKPFTEDDLRAVKGLAGVKEAGRRISGKGKAELPGEPEMLMNFVEGNTVSTMLLDTGEPWKEGLDGVWLDRTFAEKRGIRPGDVINLKWEGISFPETVRGTIHHPEYVYYVTDVAAMMPDYGTYGMCFLDVSQFPDPDSLVFDTMVLDLAEVDNMGGLSKKEKAVCEAMAAKLRRTLDSDILVISDKDDILSYQTFRAEMEQHRAMAFLFPVVFLLISILGIITTMTRLTARQRVQIGTLKALGFSRRIITAHYVSYGFVLSLLGSLLGAAAGYYYIVNLIVSMFSTTYLLPNPGGKMSGTSAFVIAAEVLISSLVSFAACRRELAPPPAETLRPASPKNLKLSLLEKSRFWKSLDFASQWNLRDILRNKARTGMGILGVAGCCMLILSAFGCLDSIVFITGWMYGELNTASCQIIMKNGTSPGDVKEYAEKYRGQMMESSAAEFVFGNQTKSGTVTVLDTGNYMHFQDGKGQHISLTQDGVAMSCKMASNLGLRQGQTVRWHLEGDEEWHTDRVVQLYRNPGTQGLTMTRKTWERHEFRFCPLTVLTNMTPEKELADKDPLVDSVQNTGEMMSAMDQMKAMMYMMVGILTAAAVILGVVVLYNLGVLSLIEKTREMATLKVLGFRTRQIRGILRQQNLWITAAGTLLGIPLGLGLLNEIMADMPESMDYTAVVFPASYLYAAAGTFLLSLLVNQWLSLKVKTIDMVDALKGPE